MNPQRINLLSGALLLASIAACDGASHDSDTINSAPAADKSSSTGTAMVVTANPHATSAGEAILRQGGSAVDAAVAIEAMLSLVEPQSSGLGGGGFMTYYDAKTKTIAVYDGRETAPAKVTPELFLDEQGEVRGFLKSKNSGLSIGVPGVVDMLALAHSEHGKLPWDRLFDASITLAEGGFDPSPRLKSFFDNNGRRLIDSGSEDGPKEAQAYFFGASGELRERLVNPEYAETLRAISVDHRALYRGPIAEAIVAAAQQPPRAGTLSLDDMDRYSARKLEPLCVNYRGLDVCGPPPPSSWLGVGMMLGMLEAADFPSDDRLRDWNTYAAVQRLAYADRDQYVGDDTFVSVPVAGMLDPGYIVERATMIGAAQNGDEVEPGDPWAFENRQAGVTFGRDTTEDYAGTTHFVVVDRWGNAVSMTATVESIFGSARMAGGMFLNNEMTDFARNPRDSEGVLVANHPAPGKRPRSSMSPTIALDADGDFVLATGSPGGNSILAYTSKTLIGMLDWGLTPQEAIDLPNVVARGKTVRVESARADESLLASLRQAGFKVKESAGETSGLSIVRRLPDGSLQGGVDPRREGTIAAIE